MDEYLSKPLKQNHLIQTILKCATLGGQLLEKGRDGMNSTTTEEAQSAPSNAATNGTVTKAVAPPVVAAKDLLRPALESRAFTTTGPISHGSLESPSIVAADQDDPLARLLMRAHSS